jgi:hypothetical protein
VRVVICHLPRCRVRAAVLCGWRCGCWCAQTLPRVVLVERGIADIARDLGLMTAVVPSAAPVAAPIAEGAPSAPFVAATTSPAGAGDAVGGHRPVYPSGSVEEVFQRRRPLYRTLSSHHFFIRDGDSDWAAISRDFCRFLDRVVDAEGAVAASGIWAAAGAALAPGLPAFFVCITVPDVTAIGDDSSAAAAWLRAVTVGVEALELRVDLLASQISVVAFCDVLCRAVRGSSTRCGGRGWGGQQLSFHARFRIPLHTAALCLPGAVCTNTRQSLCLGNWPLFGASFRMCKSFLHCEAWRKAAVRQISPPARPLQPLCASCACVRAVLRVSFRGRYCVVQRMDSVSPGLVCQASVEIQLRQWPRWWWVSGPLASLWT